MVWWWCNGIGTSLRVWMLVTWKLSLDSLLFCFGVAEMDWGLVGAFLKLFVLVARLNDKGPHRSSPSYLYPFDEIQNLTTRSDGKVSDWLKECFCRENHVQKFFQLPRPLHYNKVLFFCGCGPVGQLILKFSVVYDDILEACGHEYIKVVSVTD